MKHPNGEFNLVCLCGSTKFKAAFEKAVFDESLAGNIVLSVACFMHADSVPVTPEQKIHFDALHKQKITLADEILVLNVGGYIGESTLSEIRHAVVLGKRIRFLEPARVQLGTVTLTFDPAKHSYATGSKKPAGLR